MVDGWRLAPIWVAEHGREGYFCSWQGPAGDPSLTHATAIPNSRFDSFGANERPVLKVAERRMKETHSSKILFLLV